MSYLKNALGLGTYWGKCIFLALASLHEMLVFHWLTHYCFLHPLFTTQQPHDKMAKLVNSCKDIPKQRVMLESKEKMSVPVITRRDVNID